MFQNLLLTCSVKAVTDHETDIQKASKVRSDIADIKIWDKANDVETTFLGTMEVTGFSESEKNKMQLNKCAMSFGPFLKKIMREQRVC